MKVGNYVSTKQIIEENDFHIKKKFGQNFIVDENILKKIVKESMIDDSMGVIEIGPGLGSLTQHLCSNANKVMCYEIDDDLIPILNKTLKDFDNVNVIHKDVLQANIDEDIDKYLSGCDKIVVVANLPYYITTMILMHLLENSKKISSYVVMVQKEVGDRLCSKPSVKDYNALSVAVQYRCSCKKVISIPKTIFIPAPNVDSSVIKLDVIDREIKPNDVRFFFSFVKAAFNQRRKTFVNNISERYNKSKADIGDLLEANGYRRDIRAEMISTEEFIKLSDVFLLFIENKEILDLYDDDFNLVGKTVVRGEKIPPEYNRLVVFVVLRNTVGQYLIQKRGLDKAAYPGMWTVTGGAVVSKESSVIGAQRELFEEMGVEVPLDKFVLKSRLLKKEENAILDTYLVDEFDCVPMIDNKEVIDYKFVSLEDIEKMVLNNTFIKIDYIQSIKSCL